MIYSYFYTSASNFIKYYLMICGAAVVVVPVALELDIMVELVVDGKATNGSVCVAFTRP